MKIFFKILFLALIVTSCSDVEPTVFNGNDTSNPTFLSFSRVKYTLPIERDGAGSVDVVLNTSTLSSSDRTFDVDVIIAENNPANPDTYTVPGSVTIPANEYSGILTITGVDEGLVDGSPESFFLKLNDESIANVNMDSNLVEVAVLEACVSEEPFLGAYNIEQTSPFFGPAGTSTFTQGIVDLVPGSSPIERDFDVTYIYPNPYNLPGQTITILFTCDGATIANTVDTGIGCSAGVNIMLGPSASPGSYDAENDSEFELIFTENSTSTCGTGSIQTTYRFTRVE